MQKHLFLDYLDGTLKDASKNKLGINLSMQNYVTLDLLTRSYLLNINNFPRVHYDSLYDSLKAKYKDKFEFIHEILHDPIFPVNNALIDLSVIQKDSLRKNYIFSKPLTSALASTKIDKDINVINKMKSFYFEMPGITFGNYNILGVVGFSTIENNQLFLRVTAFYLNNGEIRIDHTSLPLSKLSSLTSEFNYAVDTNSQEINEPLMWNAILNGIIYIYNNSEEMLEKLNQFSESNIKRKKETKLYTSKSYVNLGLNAQFLKLLLESEIGVRGHFRWQPCGTGRKDFRLIYVRPHARLIDKFTSIKNSLAG